MFTSGSPPHAPPPCVSSVADFDVYTPPSKPKHASATHQPPLPSSCSTRLADPAHRHIKSAFTQRHCHRLRDAGSRGHCAAWFATHSRATVLAARTRTRPHVHARTQPHAHITRTHAHTHIVRFALTHAHTTAHRRHHQACTPFRFHTAHVPTAPSHNSTLSRFDLTLCHSTSTSAPPGALSTAPIIQSSRKRGSPYWAVASFAYCIGTLQWHEHAALA